MIGATEFQAGALDKRYFGVVVGLITDIVDPDNQGRVKVKFPWYDDQTQTEWCRVVYLGAGPGHGFVAVPELQTECLLAFEHGDMRRPYVLGGLFNGVDAPPTYRKEDDVRDEKLLRTRAGHQLLFRDTKNDTQVELTTAGGHALRLRDQGKSGGAMVTVRTNGGHQLEMDDAGTKITLATSAGQKIVLEGNGTVTITAATVKLEATTRVELGAGALQSIVLGDNFMKFFDSHVHVLGAATTGPPAIPASTLPGLLSLVTKTS